MAAGTKLGSRIQSNVKCVETVSKLTHFDKADGEKNERGENDAGCCQVLGEYIPNGEKVS